MTETEKRGLSAHLDDAIAAHYVDDTAPPPAPPPSDDGAPPAPAPEAKEPAAGDDRPRGPDGKFLPKDAEPVSAKAKPSDKEPGKVAAPDAKPQAQDTPAPEPVEAHPMWSAQLKAEFAKWPREVQEAFRNRYRETEADYTKKTQELSEARKAVEPVLAVTQRHQPFLQQIGYTPDRFVEESVAVAQRLMSGTPQHQGQAIAYLMQLHRIPPEAVLQALGVPLNPGETVAVNPVMQQLHQTQLELAQRLQSFEQRSEQTQRMMAQAEFDAIGQSTDQNGDRLYPHWDRVKDTMINLVANGQSDSWDKAYRKAVRLDDELYDSELQAAKQSVAADEAKRRQEAVDKAKKAAPIATTPTAPGGGNERKGLAAHLSAAMERHFQE